MNLYLKIRKYFLGEKIVIGQYYRTKLGSIIRITNVSYSDINKEFGFEIILLMAINY